MQYPGSMGTPIILQRLEVLANNEWVRAYSYKAPNRPPMRKVGLPMYGMVHRRLIRGKYYSRHSNTIS